MAITINKHNTITKEEGILFEVRTPITLSLIGEDQYPIYDLEGNLYSLGEHEMTVYFDEDMLDKIAMRINGEAYYIPTSRYEFEVSPNEMTSFLTFELAFNIHADSEEDAYYKLHNILCDEKNVICDFKIFDINLEETYEVDVLCIQYSGMYKAEVIDLGLPF